VKVIIASDHGGYKLKEELKKFLKDKKYEVVDYGTYSEEPVDYPDLAMLVATTVAQNSGTCGIIIDGVGVASAIVANKIPGIRAVPCYDSCTARISRLHNNSNILTLGGRIVGIELAKDIVEVWLNTPFEGGRHIRRLEKIAQIEKKFTKNAFY